MTIDINKEIEKGIQKQKVIEGLFWNWYSMKYDQQEKPLDKLVVNVLAKSYAELMDVEFDYDRSPGKGSNKVIRP